ncbi:hypothetical protein D8B26_003416 [Coccidioides posadasii str. Silveira]|uniref:Fe2OG dioxygenase domain-containing protein n=3 Tax=Coccidioides posadasii TaxID=199306 RepID=E9CZN4_COCPS|nr:hypothetical protein CPC735_004020 [Coccidioides posadasii C735 delta SOWgp]EER26231.1 hypothetical protein CPC735_004020 [Coccidioides posadasii C735 delta SOWgp]EFW20137.1 conserved hypothetical protein [Coccidioides posadasii str. Silveira]KMM73298.1 hypothetical protein CPAG_09587 [Coccidioides posadasii RMSCC 3488]QVM08741.1 hypothetical protein D8B26_003416 [Coccidioides posadasii str. Silveira]|eukprot:XP_003068376.1 hypothetical protein CPC735_004020 [Coccidioides posadasii C735 delta SOWgp]
MPPKSKPKATNNPKSKSSSEPTKSHRQEPATPNWPPLKPLIPSSDLALETVLSDQIYVVRNLFTSTLCKNYVSFLSTLPLVTTPGRPKRGDAVRVNDRFQVDDLMFAERLWKETALSQVVLGQSADADSAEGKDLWGGEVLGLNPNIRVYRYSKGQFFGQHYDDSVSLHLPSLADRSLPGKTTWTLLIYLTTCTGGETVFYPEPVLSSKKNGSKSKPLKDNNVDMDPIAVELEVGMALLHRHGDKCLLHEGREVKQGEKWVIRSDLVVRR